jgi:hypothetical protein
MIGPGPCILRGAPSAFFIPKNGGRRPPMPQDDGPLFGIASQQSGCPTVDTKNFRSCPDYRFVDSRQITVIGFI